MTNPPKTPYLRIDEDALSMSKNLSKRPTSTKGALIGALNVSQTYNPSNEHQAKRNENHGPNTTNTK